MLVVYGGMHTFFSKTSVYNVALLLVVQSLS